MTVGRSAAIGTRAPDPEPLPAPPPSRLSQSANRWSAAPRAKRLPSRWLLFGGQLRQQLPRLRIIIGFVLALGLGAILPTCHARSVIRDKIEPARQELSRAKAYGHLLADQGGFRNAEEIEDYISSVKFRGGTYDVLIWLACGGLVSFLWTRYT